MAYGGAWVVRRSRAVGAWEWKKAGGPRARCGTPVPRAHTRRASDAGSVCRLLLLKAARRSGACSQACLKSACSRERQEGVTVVVGEVVYTVC